MQINSHKETNAQPASSSFGMGPHLHIFIAEHDVLCVEYLTALGQSQLCLLPDFLLTGAEWEMEKAVMLHKHWPAVVETLVDYQHLSGHKSKPQHYVGCHEESQLHASQTQYAIWNPCAAEVRRYCFLLIKLFCFLFSLLHIQKKSY